jgi:hypothetical protein
MASKLVRDDARGEACSQSKRERDVGLSGAAVAQQQNVLAASDELG